MSARPATTDRAMPAVLAPPGVPARPAKTVPAESVRAAVRAQHAREHHEPMLLRIIETAVERPSGICDLLERRAARLHRVGGGIQSLDGIRRAGGARARRHPLL